jgi:hypothetical protein
MTGGTLNPWQAPKTFLYPRPTRNNDLIALFSYFCRQSRPSFGRPFPHMKAMP